jgi:hypothetical protein
VITNLRAAAAMSTSHHVEVAVTMIRRVAVRVWTFPDAAEAAKGPWCVAAMRHT